MWHDSSASEMGARKGDSTVRQSSSASGSLGHPKLSGLDYNCSERTLYPCREVRERQDRTEAGHLRAVGRVRAHTLSFRRSIAPRPTQHQRQPSSRSHSSRPFLTLTSGPGDDRKDAGLTFGGSRLSKHPSLTRPTLWSSSSRNGALDSHSSSDTPRGVRERTGRRVAVAIVGTELVLWPGWR